MFSSYDWLMQLYLTRGNMAYGLHYVVFLFTSDFVFVTFVLRTILPFLNIKSQMNWHVIR